MEKKRFKNQFSENIFRFKYAQGPNDSWDALADRIVEDVCGTRWGKSHKLLSDSDRDQLSQYIKEMKFIPGGRYLYYSGRPLSYWNNCYLLRAEEDTREEWSNVTWRAMSCLMTGGGIGSDYSLLRPSGRPLVRTGGKASGPLPLMYAVNEIGRNVMQGGSRRSAIYASLNWKHEDIPLFLRAKNWAEQPIVDGVTHWDAKNLNFNHHAPLDMTNISVNYDDEWLNPSAPYGGKAELDVIVRAENTVFLENCKQAMMTGEPGFSFNFGDKQNETLRNAPLGPDTYVLTVDGYRQIRDIVDSTVKIWTGQQWANTVFRKTGESVPVVRVAMSGRREIIAEPSHEFFLEDGSKKAAKDLEEGDNLLIQLNNEVDSFLCEDYYSLGYIYGDGTFHRLYPRAEVSFCTEESKECFDNFDKSLITSFVASDSRGYLRAYTKNNKLFSHRRKEIFPEDLLGSQSGTAQQCSFLAGLFDADGNYVEERGTVRLASKHEEFLQGVRRLLESLGILSGISTAGISTYGQSQGYILTVYSEHTTRFAEIIPTKRLKVKPYGSYRKAKIKVLSVEDAGFSDVFCCDVGVPEHSFMAEGVIVSNCTEVTSEDDSDVCNLGSINLGNISSLEEFGSIVNLASKFLVCGTLRADLPYEKVYKVREKNRRIGLGLMGIHEWLLRRGYGYEVVPELHEWLKVYKSESEKSANEHCDRLFISRPVAYRAIAPTGTIGILAATTTGIEPLFAVAYKRRYLTDGTKWRYEYVVDSTADRLITDYAIDPDTIETAYKLSNDYEKRIKFQADVQDYVDMSISSTINLPPWGTKNNNEDSVRGFSEVLARYAPRLRGFTCYPDGSRGGQPITEVDYKDAIEHKGVIFEEHDICDISGKGGSCGV